MTKHFQRNLSRVLGYSYWILAIFILLLSGLTYAEKPLLSAENAFLFSVESSQKNQAELSWKIPEHYYLYAQQFSVQNNHQKVHYKLPKAIDLYDDNYGHTQVYFNAVHFEIPTQASQTYTVTWQGCAKDRLCYPPQTIEFHTNADGLVSVQNQGINTHSKTILDLANAQNVDKKSSLFDQNVEASNKEQISNQVAQDQIWSEKLMESSWVYGFLLFFGLGFLLAFTPCSLPMLPILTSLIIRNHRGLKAWMIALVFVCSMASVYALLGLIASSAGLGFQRWLQQPSTLMAFSLLFVIFALNLFGLFEIKLPQALVNRLDHAQSMQKGGTLLGAAVMGMLSALLVGPCMTAPLAGALLFISQTQSQWHGALLLFILGFGMGMPLLLASILGSHILPKAGQWMNQVKILFAFLMLGLALYFIRPLLPESWLQILSLSLGLAFLLYLVISIYRESSQLKWFYVVVLVLTFPYVIYDQYQHSQRFFIEESQQHNDWHIAHSAIEFEQLLSRAPAHENVIIDVYADWCVACQPIEHKVLKSAEVQKALKGFYLIKLDLSHYDQSHQALLNQWDILGPPTYLFLNSEHQEIRHLRLTGAFTEEELLHQLQQLKNKKD